MADEPIDEAAVNAALDRMGGSVDGFSDAVDQLAKKAARLKRSMHDLVKTLSERRPAGRGRA